MKKLLFAIVGVVLSFNVFGQQAAVKTESHVYRKLGDRVVISLNVNGVSADFLLDLNGKMSILPDFAQKIGVRDSTATGAADLPQKRQVQASFKCMLATLAFGNNVFGNNVPAILLQGESAKYLRDNGVVGVVNASFFKNVVLTIDKRGGSVLTSIPYKPAFMRLSERIDCDLSNRGTVEFIVAVSNKPTKVLFDTWEPSLLVMDKGEQLKKKYLHPAVEIGNQTYGENQIAEEVFEINQISCVNVNISNQVASVDPQLSKPILGLGILDYGVISIDFGKSKVYFQSYDGTVVNTGEKLELAKIESGKLNAITKDEFIGYIYDYKSSKDFILKGDKPVIIDFWASWCGPCMRLMPTMEKLAEKYKDQVLFFKVNADMEKELCARFNVIALPTMFLIKPGQSPIVEVGDQPGKIIEIIEKQLLGR